ncbi:hypothetical protein Patl1_33717 [Pistacia atlantica]|uniref:Uncharacterized protein n=1 Tax=Pistacia atlantica TaxID=434234 RepID=A0ACC0ZQ98_9ROSI|nr:hypothetical protein Patl1_33717 [Pistacia atlantica]
MKATAENTPPGFEESKSYEAADLLVKVASNCCGRLIDHCCCMCFIQTCSSMNKQCSIVLTQLCAALACLDVTSNMALRVVGFFILVCISIFSRSLTDASLEREKTLAMVKPDGVLGNYTDEIKRVILESGFNIFKEKISQLDEEQTATFYAEHYSKSFFSSLIKYMTRSESSGEAMEDSVVSVDEKGGGGKGGLVSIGPVLVMVLEKENAVADWRALIGPTDARKAKNTHPHSIRAMCGLDSEKNCVHGSDSLQSAQREISFFFNEMSSG